MNYKYYLSIKNQKETAEILGISQKTISNYLKEKTFPDIKVLKKILKNLILHQMNYAIIQ